MLDTVRVREQPASPEDIDALAEISLPDQVTEASHVDRTREPADEAHGLA